jgi:hypothetical protein
LEQDIVKKLWGFFGERMVIEWKMVIDEESEKSI